MKYIVFLVLSLISTSWTQITWTVLKAAAGKSITVQFPWKWDQKHPVMWCKSYSETKCKVIVRIEKSTNNNFHGTTSISYIHGSISVTMEQLQEKNTGTYWCGAQKQGSIVVSDVILLKVFTDSEESIPTETYNVMQNTIIVSCLYTQQERHYKKFFLGIPAISSDNLSNTTLQIWHIIIPALLGLLILSLLILFLWKRKGIKRAGNDVKNENPETPDMTTKSDRIMKDTVTYSNVTLQPSAQTTEDSGTYANLKDLKEQKGSIKINSSESVEYAALQFKS
ncbi:uncharacterized protein LOC132828281 isoform X2 [Hemiscyllium ocellatum]|uniref:uncharacterized protein LOC132828281 isoform X2 n=1 Tax=Hemiscyllium ocellatum TaxID=170820 RepID=UPI002966E482|nr:uncharacterized protein LOC132828281 isoform X2 [Hemiscyllium ocellatum]